MTQQSMMIETEPAGVKHTLAAMETKLTEARADHAAAQVKQREAEGLLQAALTGSDASTEAKAHKALENAVEAVTRASRKVEALQEALGRGRKDAVPALAQEVASDLETMNSEAITLAHGFGLAIEQAYAAAEKLAALSREHSNAARAFTSMAAEWGVPDARLPNGKFGVVMGEVRRTCKLTIPERFRVSRASVLAPGFEFPADLAKGGSNDAK